jgi:hypothetical protein
MPMDRPSAKTSFLDARPEFKDEHPVDDPDTAVYYLKNATAVSEDFDGHVERFCF